MLTNDGRILSTTISGTTYTFASQVIDSYIGSNGCSTQLMRITTSGITVNDSLSIYYQEPFETIKCTITTDLTNYQTYFPPTYENSVKKYYFTGNLDAVSALRFYGYNYCWDGTYYTGDLIKTMGQFPNLRSFEIAGDDWACDYIGSFFNRDISFTSFPTQIQRFTITDSSLSGNIETIENFEKIENLRLTSVPFVGSLSTVFQENLKTLQLLNTYDICGNVGDILDNNPNFSSIHLANTSSISGCVTDWNVSGLTCMYLQIYNNSYIDGDLSNWKFNSGLTCFYLYNNNYIDGDLTTWDFSDTQLLNFTLYNYQYTNPVLCGNLSGWTFPSTIQTFELYYVTGLTSIMQDFSAYSNMCCFRLYYAPQVCADIANFEFPNSMSQISLGVVSMYGDIGQFSVPTGVTSLEFTCTCISGNISGLTLNTGSTSCLRDLYFTDNYYITGDVAKFVIPETLEYMYLYNSTGLTFNLNTAYDTKNLYQILLSDITCVSGDLSNLIISNPYGLDTFSITNTCSDSDLSKLDYGKICYIDAANVCGLYGDLTNWFSGTTHYTYGLQISNNLLISGNTGGWNVDSMESFQISNTCLGGALKHNAAYWFYIDQTNICSTLPDDIDFSGLQRGNMFCANLQGWLTGLSINYGLQYFSVSWNPNLYGSNEFVDYLFENRRNWSYPYNIGFEFSCIGDRLLPTGGTETTGDTGTWSSCIWDLTEDNVNNLVDGLDYDGAGSNTPWNPYEKIWWWRYAEASSVNPTRRYCNFYVSY